MSVDKKESVWRSRGGLQSCSLRERTLRVEPLGGCNCPYRGKAAIKGCCLLDTLCFHTEKFSFFYHWSPKNNRTKQFLCDSTVRTRSMTKLEALTPSCVVPNIDYSAELRHKTGSNDIFTYIYFHQGEAQVAKLSHQV